MKFSNVSVWSISVNKFVLNFLVLFTQLISMSWTKPQKQTKNEQRGENESIEIILTSFSLKAKAKALATL